MESDKGRIKQVLMNLLANSLKFTFNGAISLKVRLTCANRESFIEVCVSDTGIGIKKEDLPRLFKLFGMIDQGGQLNPHGCGIGLTICKKYIEKLGGDIWIESIYEQGTKTFFTIPLKEQLTFERYKRLVTAVSNEADQLHESSLVEFTHRPSTIELKRKTGRES